MGARVACVGCDEGGGITYSRSRFNPRALIEQVYRWVVFQSTRPRGARLTKYSKRKDQYKFQSTRPRGARLYIITFCFICYMFQSTRPRGARPECD